MWASGSSKKPGPAYIELLLCPESALILLHTAHPAAPQADTVTQGPLSSGLVLNSQKVPTLTDPLQKPPELLNYAVLYRPHSLTFHRIYGAGFSMPVFTEVHEMQSRKKKSNLANLSHIYYSIFSDFTDRGA